MALAAERMTICGSLPRFLLLILTTAIAMSAFAVESVCFGTVSNGRLERGVKLPPAGSNFSPCSDLASNVGRTYVHSKVFEIVVAAYAALEQSASGKVFVYGETGWSTGGRIRPHRTHQNGLSVDFFVPVQDRTGRSVPLPTDVTNRFGYDIEFDKDGRFNEYTIDFEALAEHLYQLHTAAKARGVKIALVILDPPYLPRLFATARGPFLRQTLNFMKSRAWVRHDEHYHVDFAIPCRPLKG
jgi:penicillin-insensitive murein DD-endopeptidase